MSKIYKKPLYLSPNPLATYFIIQRVLQYQKSYPDPLIHFHKYPKRAAAQKAKIKIKKQIKKMMEWKLNNDWPSTRYGQ